MLEENAYQSLAEIKSGLSPVITEDILQFYLGRSAKLRSDEEFKKRFKIFEKQNTCR
jgi:hypothetical protein